MNALIKYVVTVISIICAGLAVASVFNDNEVLKSKVNSYINAAHDQEQGFRSQGWVAITWI